MPVIGIYARVSTPDQDLQRQLDELNEHVDREYPEATVETYADVISGADEQRGDEFDRLWNDIEAGDLDVAVVHEISRLSRLGGAAIYEFIQHALEHEAGVESLDVGLSIRVDDPALQQTLYTMVANIMGDLAKIEHQQKMNRINTGIMAAQQAGKWTGRPPRGFWVDDDNRLRVDVEEFLHVRAALERVANGESRRSAAEATGIPESTVRRLYNDEERRAMYFDGVTDDNRVATALDEIRPLPDVEISEDNELDERIRAIVQEELNNQ